MGSEEKKVIVITGASSGFGALTAIVGEGEVIKVNVKWDALKSHLNCLIKLSDFVELRVL
ncbi:hypothetical protein [Peribacillus simplex]|uniref:hypothetical protein n=1 Tax=Peribacillus simplex TaxID=1478 RepID=UPI000BA70B00|nr:hypothetical protein [Peribacillus simplex]PAK39795.1 hypothetical protein CHI08_16820 [Peribacillus simplex]